MNKQVFFMVTALLFVAGCNGISPMEIYRGTSGVDIRFMDSAPQTELYEESEVMISVEAWNRGAYNLIYDDEFAIIGVNYDPLYFRSVSDATTIDGRIETPVWLHGRSLEWPDGERDLVNVALLEVRGIEGTRERPTTNIKANICYPYMTFLTENVCIDVDIYDIADTPVCKNQPMYSYSSQGAPVTITRIESQMLPAGSVRGTETSGMPVVGPDGWVESFERAPQDTTLMRVQPSFTIHLRNAGNGIVLTRDEDTSVEYACGGRSGMSYTDINRLKVRAWLGNDELICQPENVSIMDGTGQARCHLPRDESYVVLSNYIETLSVEVNYF